jgi:peptidoglycan/LPS O-acetylase OafA/YrhL/SAM-dependent methyltransferase
MVMLGHGWLGVDLFFVLSGFLITGILLDTRDTPHYFRNFYGRRALRIIPLYFVCIALMSCFYSGYTHYFVLSLLFMANLAGSFGAATPRGPGVFWSLAVEEHFYFVWPCFVRLLNRRSLAVLCGAIVLAEPSLRAIYSAQGVFVYPLSWFRFDSLAAGALLALWFRSPLESKRRSMILAAACIAAAVVLTIAGLPYGINSMTVAGKSLRYTQATLVFCPLMLVAIAARSTSLTALLRSRFACVTGDLSYCLYLVHLSILDGYMSVFRRFVPVGFTLLHLMLRTVIVLSLSYAVALLSRRFLERPFLSLKQFLGGQPCESPVRWRMVKIYWFALNCGLKCFLRGDFRNGIKFLIYPVGYWRLLPNALLDREFARIQPRDVLDVGSPKLMSLRFAALGAKVMATDLDDPALYHRWLESAQTLELGDYHVDYQDATALPYPDASFDLVYSISVVEHIPNDRAAVSEMLRVTRPGGCVIVEVPYREHPAIITRETDSKGKPVTAPVFYERRYDGDLLRERLTAGSAPVIQILGESLYFDPVISGELRAPKPLRALLWPLEPLVAFWNFGENRKRPLSAFLTYQQSPQ